jgi:hypothetical protein
MVQRKDSKMFKWSIAGVSGFGRVLLFNNMAIAKCTECVLAKSKRAGQVVQLLQLARGSGICGLES